MGVGRSNLPVSVIVIAQNEEPNIEQCLTSVVGWAELAFVVDGFSTDRTPKLARACGAKVVQHEFVDWASQRNWALENLPLETEWVFFLDADEAISPAFETELQQLLNSCTDDLAGIYVRFAFWFLGRELRHAYEAPPVMRIVRRGRAVWTGVGAREYCTVNGSTTVIQERILHRDLKGLSAWIEKHNRNATREAQVLLDTHRNPGNSLAASAQTERAWRIFLRQAVYNRLPPVVRPFFYFLYRYITRLGFLDGLPGFAYCFLHGFWYPLLVDVKLMELRQGRGKP